MHENLSLCYFKVWRYYRGMLLNQVWDGYRCGCVDAALRGNVLPFSIFDYVAVKTWVQHWDFCLFDLEIGLRQMRTDRSGWIRVYFPAEEAFLIRCNRTDTWPPNSWVSCENGNTRVLNIHTAWNTMSCFCLCCLGTTCLFSSRSLHAGPRSTTSPPSHFLNRLTCASIPFFTLPI